MSELNSTFRVDEPIFEWPKTTAKSPSRPQVKISKAALSNIPTPCRAQRVQFNAAPEKASSTIAPKLPCGPRRVPVTQASATPYRDPNALRHGIYTTPSTGNEKQAAASVMSAGPGRVPVTKANATPYRDPNVLRRTIYVTTPSTGTENRTAVCVTSARKTLPPPRRVPMSEYKSEKSQRKSRADNVQKLLIFEEEDVTQ